jgi:hypothetical protein
MAFQSVPNTVSAEIRYSLWGKNIENVLHFQHSGAYVGADLNDLSELIDMWVVTTWLPLLPTSVVYRETFVRGLTNATDLFSTNATGAGENGALNEGNANNMSKALKFGTGNTGRNARGRLFVPAIPQAVLVTDNYVTQDWVDDLIAAIESLIAAAQTIGWILSIVSRFLAGVKRAVGVTFPVTNVSVTNLTTDSMRGRMLVS